jgi:23S rRNA pseudouridine2457 synthase
MWMDKQTEEQNDREYILYKPCGYLSQFVNNGPKKGKKKLLGELGDFCESTMSIGRLDEQSEGLLLLTTNGKTSQLICSGKVEKEYYAQVDGSITEDAIAALSQGVEIGLHGQKYQTRPPCNVYPLRGEPDFPKGRKIRDARHGPTSWVSITLREGKYRQIRKMTAAVGFPTLRLLRVRIGCIELKGMKVGEVIEVDGLLETLGLHLKGASAPSRCSPVEALLQR